MKQTAKTLRQRPWWLRGQALVEFSLILPILLWLLLGIIDYGRILLVFSNTSNSIRNAARLATIFNNDSTGTPFYVSCTSIEAAARDVLFPNEIQSVNILYYKTNDLDPVTGNFASMATRIANADVDPNQASYDCDGDNSLSDPPQVNSNVVSTGDLMVVTVNSRIEFITPILAGIFPTYDINFRAQRTVISTLTLELLGPDREPDGLADHDFELTFFGCLLENWDEPPKNPGDDPLVAIRPTGVLILITGSGTIGNVIDNTWDRISYPTFGATDLNNPATWGMADYTADCATEELNPDAFAEYLADNGHYPNTCTYVSDPDGDYLECITPNTQEFSATGDPDFDGCNNGCEEARGTNPIDGLPGANSQDTDGDGLLDGAETFGFTLNLVINGTPVSRFVQTDPLEEDTDLDGLSDGDEVNLYGTDPTVVDTDGDGLRDGLEVSLYNTDPAHNDTDRDGLLDNVEVNGLTVTLTINGVVRTVAAKTSPTNPDTDGDGLGDNAEYTGTAAGGKILNPAAADTDGDGLEDGDEISTHNTDPTLTDTDTDGLSDGEEVNTYGSDPNNVNSDGDTCSSAQTGDTTVYSLNDYFEVKGPFVTFLGDDDDDANNDGIYNSMELDSDGDNLDDCEEVYYYATNPYLQDTDGGGLTDDEEVALFCKDPTDPADDGDNICTNVGLDSEPDGNTDQWEEDNFGIGMVGLYVGTDDPDNDRCTNICEEARKTDPLNPDTDGDGLYDGDEIGTLPLDPDSDNDGLLDGSISGLHKGERNGSDGSAGWGTDPILSDTDFDGLNDFDEVTTYLTNPINRDTDSDGLSDGEEVNGINFQTTINGVDYNLTMNTNPLSIDTDGDGLSDSNEIFLYKTFPNSNGSAPSINPLDSDGDTLQDGSTPGIIGERASDFDSLLDAYGTDPISIDTDGDGLCDGPSSDPICTCDPDGDPGTAAVVCSEVGGINGYVIVLDGTPQSPINLAGFDVDNQTSTSNLNPFNFDTDGDGLQDGYEVFTSRTNPLLANTDSDGYPLDGTDPEPLVPDQADTDLDGISDDVEFNASPPTDPERFDSDGDRMGDGDEQLTGMPNIVFTCHSSCSPASPYSINGIQLDTTFQRSGSRSLPTGLQYGDGYDSDGDGLSDVYELFWYQSTATVKAIHPEFNGFLSNGFERCNYLINNPPPIGSRYPLHPDRADTDQDGLKDGDECNVYNTNPFDGTAEGDIFAKVTSPSLLNSVIYPALAGDLTTASINARTLNYALGADGRITLSLTRSPKPAPPVNRWFTQGSLVTTACGPSAYTTSGGSTTIFPNLCGQFVGAEPNDATQVIQIRIALSEFYTILSSNTVAGLAPVSN